MTRRRSAARKRAAAKRAAPVERAAPTEPEPPARAARLAPVLAAAVRTGLGLLLLTPLVISPATYYPFVVGKAVYARSVVEVVVALWVVLAVLAPAYRPRRSWVLVLLAVGLAWAAAAAVFGVAPERSFWSGFERMRGVVDAAHWAALSLVAACVLRTPAQWTALLTAGVAVSAAVAALAVLQHFGVAGVPLYGEFPRSGSPRPTGPLGNPIYLATYLLLNVMLGVGLLVRSLAPQAAPVDGSGADGPVRAAGLRAGGAWAWRSLWLGCAALAAWAAALAASIGPLVGTACGVAAVAVVGTFLARGRRGRVLGFAALCLTAVLAAAPFAAGSLAPAGFAESVPTTVLRRAVEIGSLDDESVASRLAAWRAGFEGLAERPLLGWGPENFRVVFGRYADDLPAGMIEHDLAHNALVEELVAKGWPGGVLYLGLWAATFLALVRAARRSAGRDRVLALTAGGALAAYFAATQTLFATTVWSMQCAVLLGFAAGLEMRTRPARPRGRRRLAPQSAPAGAAIVAVAAAAGGLAVAGLWSNLAVYRSAAALNEARAFAVVSALPEARDRAAEVFAEALAWYGTAIDAFGPLANDVRMHLFRDVAGFLQRSRPRLVPPAWLDAEAAAAVAAEPRNWKLRFQLAIVYAEAADADVARIAAARRHIDALGTLAPNADGVLRLYGRPAQAGPIRALHGPDGVLLEWPRDPNVLTYVLVERVRGQGWATVYEGVARRVVVEPPTAGSRKFRVKACRGVAGCGRWSDPARVGAAAR